jgi:predicted HTH transcriptional regulator
MSLLNELLTHTEGKTLEFKRDLSSPEKVIRTVVAFANGAGGTIIIGVEDGTRRVAGVTDAQRLEEQLASMIWDRIEPRLTPELHVIPWRKKNVVAVHVFPSSQRPHFIKALGLPAGAFVRVGSTNRVADPSQIDEMRRFVRGQSFDEEPMPEMNTEALDFRAASECFAEFRKLKPADLKTLQLTTLHQNKEVLTVGGVILFGKDRLKDFPDAFIRAGCFKGPDKTTILDSADIRDYPVLAIDRALQFIQRNTRRALIIQNAKHAEAWEFPLVALREAVINAVVHADYGQRGMQIRIAIFENRIEIENPGGLPPGLTIEEIRRGVSKLRNRVIGRVFHELHLIEQWGSGIQRMIDACWKAGLLEPRFEEIGSGFRVTFSRERAAKPALDIVDEQIIAAIRKSPGISTSGVAAEVRRTARATRNRLSRLVESGLIVPIASSPRDPRKGFHLADALEVRRQPRLDNKK